MLQKSSATVSPSRRSSEPLGLVVARQIEAEISARALKPGDRLGTKQELRQQYRVASATLNEAILVLCGKGTLEARPGPGGGIFVATRRRRPKGAWPLAVRVSRAEALANELQAEIAGYGLRPGYRLGTKEDLRVRFGVATATVNEAVRLMESRKQVIARSGIRGGVFVAAAERRRSSAA